MVAIASEEPYIIIYLVLEGDNPQAMKNMMENPEMAEVMKKAGVLGKPQVYVGEMLE